MTQQRVASSRAPSTVLVVYKSPVFARGIEAFLHGGPTVRIVGMETDATQALVAARATHPDVIVLEEIAQERNWPLVTLLELAASGRLVSVSLADVTAHVYERRDFRVNAPGGLVAAIRGVENGGHTRSGGGAARRGRGAG